MRGAIPPLPNTPSWRGAQLKKSTGTTLLLTEHYEKLKYTHQSFRHIVEHSPTLGKSLINLLLD